jgi:putative ABC transport system permease protein
MTVLSTTAGQSRASGLGLPLALRLALRELRGGLSGFYVFIICIALGVGAIATVGTVTGALRDSIARQGQVLLGGDVTAAVIHRQASDAERARFQSFGSVSEIGTMRAMAVHPQSDTQLLIDLKAVDRAYPLYGALSLASGATLDDALSADDAAIADQSLLDRLGVQVGESVRLGRATLRITDVIEREPDRLTGGAGFGPRLMVRSSVLETTGLIAPGTLITWRYQVRFDETARGDAQIAAFRAMVASELAGAGFNVTDRTDPSPQISLALSRLSEFLTLVGLAALLVGGIGVANAITAFVARKRKVMAIYKALGASSGMTLGTFGLQVLLLALGGIAIGLAFGTLIPLVLDAAFARILPIDIAVSVQPQALLLATAYGLLTGLAFILWPLGRAAQVRPAELLREHVAATRGLPPPLFIAGSVLSALSLAAAAIWLSEVRNIAALTVGGIALLLGLFWVIGTLIRRLAAALPRPRQPELALALANLGGPSGLSRTIALSLGAGLALLTTIALTDTSLRGELETELPERAPSHFFLGIPKTEFAAFDALVAERAPGAQLVSAPMLRGSLLELAGTPVEQIDNVPDAEWVLRGDRGLTFSPSLPEHSQVTEGAWWPADYDGPPLVSFDNELAEALRLKIGDEVKVNVLGRTLSARIANFRTVAWERLSINFVMIFSPNTLEDAPYQILATLNWPDARDAAAETDVLRAVARQFPSVTAIQVRDVLESVNQVLSQIMIAVRMAASLTLIAGVVVLAGAFATVQRRRIYEAVVLKVLGARRRNIVVAHMLEYIIVSLAVAAFAAGLGAGAAFLLVTQVMDGTFRFSTLALVQAGGLAIGLMILFGALATLRVLRASAAPYLRAE